MVLGSDHRPLIGCMLLYSWALKWMQQSSVSPKACSRPKSEKFGVWLSQFWFLDELDWYHRPWLDCNWVPVSPGRQHGGPWMGGTQPKTFCHTYNKLPTKNYWQLIETAIGQKPLIWLLHYRRLAIGTPPKFSWIGNFKLYLIICFNEVKKPIKSANYYYFINISTSLQNVVFPNPQIIPGQLCPGRRCTRRHGQQSDPCCLPPVWNQINVANIHIWIPNFYWGLLKEKFN